MTNSNYVNAPLEIVEWSPETGKFVLKETSRGKSGVRLEGTDEFGKKHVRIWPVPVYINPSSLNDSQN